MLEWNCRWPFGKQTQLAEEGSKLTAAVSQMSQRNGNAEQSWWGCRQVVHTQNGLASCVQDLDPEGIYNALLYERRENARNSKRSVKEMSSQS